MTLAPKFNGEAIHDTFKAWHAERESLDSQLSESLAAISAYQSHLDAWQQQLAHERDELRNAREQFERDRTTEKNHADTSATTLNELHAARDKITALTTLLLSRTEELRTLDNRRAEVQTEFELSRAREKELKVALDEHKRAVEQERSQWAEELHQLRELLERQFDGPIVDETAAHAEQAEPTVASQPAGTGARVIPRENVMFGSIVEQFGKLRQQRASDRQAFSRPR